MSKSAGGGGLKGHDKGSGGSVKVVKKNMGLESALDKVPDAFLCPAGHRMKLHNGSRREGNLTCDGPDDVCCGKDADGVLHVGAPRWSCVECDFDICETCVEIETGEELTPEQQKAALRQKLREKSGRGGNGGGAVDGAAAAAKAKADEAKAEEARRAEIAKRVAEAKAAAAAAELEAAAAPVDAAAEAAKAAKKKAAAAKKRAAQKRRKQAAAGGGAAEEEEEEEEEAAADSPKSVTAALAQETEASAPAIALSAGTASSPTATKPAAVTTPAAAAADGQAAKPFAFDWSLATPPPSKAAAAFTLSDGSDESDDDDDDSAARAPRAAGSVAEGSVAEGLAEAALGDDGLLKPPESPLACPFTQQIMRDPVILADGHTYERKAAEQYLAKFDASPRTGEKLRHKEILPNLMARELCSCAMKLEM